MFSVHTDILYTVYDKYTYKIRIYYFKPKKVCKKETSRCLDEKEGETISSKKGTWVCKHKEENTMYIKLRYEWVLSVFVN